MPKLLINVDVSDMERAIAFYTTAFELRLGRRFDAGFVELLGAQAPIYLLLNAAGTAPFREAVTMRDYARHWTPTHLDFLVDDIDVALPRALEAGAIQELPLSSHAYGRLVQLADPFGHGVCLLQYNDIGYDAFVAGQPQVTAQAANE